MMKLLRKRRKLHIARKTKKKLRAVFLTAALALIYLIFATGLVPTAVPAFSQGQVSVTRSLQQSSLYTEVLKAALPGFKAVVQEPQATPLEKINSTLLALVDINPLDPKTFLSTQISGMRSLSVSEMPPKQEQEPDSPPSSYPALLPSMGEPYLGGDFSGGIFIYHAHTTESFVPTSGVRFTTDLSQTVAALGQDLKIILEGEYGIPVLHDYTIHDTIRSNAYREARKTAEPIIAANPEIRLAVDLHRDGVARSVSTADIQGQKTGKILLVVGTGYKGSQTGMQTAKELHNNLERIAPGISRGIRERNLVYNQDLHAGALLVEVGGHENSLDEVRRTLPYLAQALAELLYQLP